MQMSAKFKAMQNIVIIKCSSALSLLFLLLFLLQLISRVYSISEKESLCENFLGEKRLAE